MDELEAVRLIGAAHGRLKNMKGEDCSGTERAEGCLEEREAFRSYITGLTWVTGEFWVYSLHREASKKIQTVEDRAQRPGFLIHSLLGMGLRATSCMESTPCDAACRKPDMCPVGVLMESRPLQSGAPLSGVARAPSPLVIDAPWNRWRSGSDLRFKVTLFGKTARFQRPVEEALIEGFTAGVGGGRSSVKVMPLGWHANGVPGNEKRERAGMRLKLVFKTPLRLVRNKKELEYFDIESLVRDLSFRLSVWGHLYQGMEWPSVWRFLWKDARSVAIARSDLRPVVFHRYSGRQNRPIPMKGLLGAVELKNVSPDLQTLLGFGEICGIGKGASIGLGRIRVSSL